VAPAAVCSEINTKHINTTWGECQFLSFNPVIASRFKMLIYSVLHLYDIQKNFCTKTVIKKGKVHPCTGTEALYRPYGP
jgi:hypothetical protein